MNESEFNEDKDTDEYFKESLKQAKNKNNKQIEENKTAPVYDMQPAAENTEQFIKKANAKVLLDTLSPEVSKNETKNVFLPL